MLHLKKKIVVLSFLFGFLFVGIALPSFAKEKKVIPAAQEASKEKSRSFLDITGNVVFWNFVTFAVLVFILGRYGWKPIIKALDDRASKIKSDITRAEQDKIESDKLLLEQKALITEAYKDGQEIINKAKDEAVQVSKELLEKTQKDAKDVIAKAQSEIELAKRNALLEIKEELGIISLEIASKVVSKSFSVDEHKSLILDTLSLYKKKA